MSRTSSSVGIDQSPDPQVRQTELQTIEQLLADLVASLPHLTTADELDMRMQGKLDLLLQLIRVLGSRCLASTDSHQLVHLLLTGMLLGSGIWPSLRLVIQMTSLYLATIATHESELDS